MIPDTAVKLAPEFVVWKRPLSVDTQISPEILGLTTTLTGEVDELKLLAAVENVFPPSVERKNCEPDAA